MVVQDDSAEARRIVALMRDSTFRRQAVCKLDAGERRRPRDFFWEKDGDDPE